MDIEPVADNNQQPNPQQQAPNPSLKPWDTLTAEQQELIRNFMQQPFTFIPPPVTTDITKTAYRENENLQHMRENLADHYQMFKQLYEIKSGKPFKFVDPTVPSSALINIDTDNKQSIKGKVYNLKFLAYTLYLSIMESIKDFKNQESIEKIKKQFEMIRKKMVDFYRVANQIKEYYRKIEVIHLLEREIDYLDTESAKIQAKIAEISTYVQTNKSTRCVTNQYNGP